MKSYYQILDVEPTCTASEIKRAFRKKAKTFHPDLKPSGKNAAMMRRLISAYQVLSDPDKRIFYDRTNREIIHRSSFDYRAFLKKRTDDPDSMAKLIFFDLLHKNEKEAIDLYDSLVTTKHYDITRYLDREDFMDCAFLLAEEYERDEEFLKAFDLLLSTVPYELESPYFRHFFREVIDKLRLLGCTRLPGKIENAELVRRLEELVDLDFSPKDTAYFLKKIAEIYVEENSLDLAKEYLSQGLSLHAKLPGAQKLVEQLAGAGRSSRGY
ncbi:MAG: DnaJ domain-containing protein [Spirochaetales bacterium]|nr:DnaJ domain-containing protein [Spirochaetales bacterium]